MDKHQLRFEVELYEDILQRDPSNMQTRLQLAYNYYYLGREDGSAEDFRKSLSHDLILHRDEPENSTHLYNIACDYALLGDKDQSFQFLEKAVSRGVDYEMLENDSDFDSLREEKRFHQILSDAKNQFNVNGERHV